MLLICQEEQKRIKNKSHLEEKPVSQNHKHLNQRLKDSYVCGWSVELTPTISDQINVTTLNNSLLLMIKYILKLQLTIIFMID